MDLSGESDKRAREYAQRAFEQAPTPEVTDTLAWILVQQGESIKAARLLQSASAGRPQNLAIKYHLAVALNNTDRPSEAIEILRPIVAGAEPFDDRQAAQSLLDELSKPKP